jgi:hypothetical protein
LGVAVVLVALGVLGAYWFAARGDAKVAVAVLARDVKRGETITGDVASVGVAVDDPIDAIRFEFVDSAVAGRTATGDLAKGTVLTKAMVTSGTALPLGKAVVGFNLAPGDDRATRSGSARWRARSTYQSAHKTSSSSGGESAVTTRALSSSRCHASAMRPWR